MKLIKSHLVNLVKNKDKSLDELTDYYYKNNVSVFLLEKIALYYSRSNQKDKIEWLLSVINNKEVFSKHYEYFVEKDDLIGFNLLSKNNVPHECFINKIIENNSVEILEYMILNGADKEKISVSVSNSYTNKSERYLELVLTCIKHNILPKYPLLTLERILVLDNPEHLEMFKKFTDLTSKDNIIFDILLEKEAIESISYMLDNYKAEKYSYFKTLHNYFNHHTFKDADMTNEDNYTTKFQSELIDLIYHKYGAEFFKSLKDENTYLYKRFVYLDMSKNQNYTFERKTVKI